MPEVTVVGAGDNIIRIKIGSDVNAALAQQLMAVVSANILNGTVTPYEDSGRGHDRGWGDSDHDSGPGRGHGNLFHHDDSSAGWPRPPAGKASLLVTAKGPVSVPANATSVFVPAGGTIFGGQAAQQLVVSGNPGIDYIANAGAGTVIAGGGNNFIDIGWYSGSHLVLTDAGNDVILALSGNDTIGAGLGHNSIFLGSGNDSVDVTGRDTIRAGAGAATITVEPDGSAVVYGGAGMLSFVDGGRASTVFAGQGASTLQAGSGNDVFVAGHGSDHFEFVSGFAGGHTEIQDFTPGRDHIALSGYGAGEAQYALSHATVAKGSLTMTLSDHTSITLDGIVKLTQSPFG